MSQIFENIKHAITNYRKDLEDQRAKETAVMSERIEEDRALLESSGVRQIFEEIRDSGLVKLRPKSDHKIGLFRRIFGGKNVIDYVPAEIVDNRIYLSLRFDERFDGCSEIRVAAIHGTINIAHGYNRVDYTPIEKGHLAEAIIEGLKNPLRVTDRV